VQKKQDLILKYQKVEEQIRNEEKALAEKERQEL